MYPSRHMHQEVTHWAVTGSDGFGGFTFGAPTLLMGRWEDKSELFRTMNGEEEVSQSIVYLSVDVDVGDYLAEGDYTGTADPTTVDAARIRRRDRSTDLGNLVALRKAYL